MITSNKINIALLAVAVILAGLLFMLVEKKNIEQVDVPTPPILTEPTSTPPTSLPDVIILPFGNTTLRVGESSQFKDISVRLMRVFDDSRCAEGVTCIWAGTIKAEVEIISGMGKSTSVIELGKEVTTEAESIILVSATPHPKAGESIESGAYQLTFSVKKRMSAVMPAPLPDTIGKCYVGGCSGEVCSDQADMASNCIYREEFACYKKTTCERQASGKCGWTETAELKSCLANPPGME